MRLRDLLREPQSHRKLDFTELLCRLPGKSNTARRIELHKMCAASWVSGDVSILRHIDFPRKQLHYREFEGKSEGSVTYRRVLSI
jgi:hypothetical protein